MTDKDIAHVESIFTGSSHILNKNGTDVTDLFITDNFANYLSGDYESIIDSLISNNFIIQEDTSPVFISPKLVVNGSVNSPIYTVYFDSVVTGNTTKEYIKFHFTGKYQYNDSTYTITAGTGVTAAIDGTSSSNCIKKAYIAGTPTWTISNNSKKITFTVNYYAELYTLNVPIPADTKSGTVSFSKQY